MENRKFTAIKKETFITVITAYPDKFGIETEDDLLEYASKNPEVELIFCKSEKDAKETLKAFM